MYSEGTTHAIPGLDKPIFHHHLLFLPISFKINMVTLNRSSIVLTRFDVSIDKVASV